MVEACKHREVEPSLSASRICDDLFLNKINAPAETKCHVFLHVGKIGL